MYTHAHIHMSVVVPSDLAESPQTIPDVRKRVEYCLENFKRHDQEQAREAAK
jgi:hypothetical protein